MGTSEKKYDKLISWLSRLELSYSVERTLDALHHDQWLAVTFVELRNFSTYGYTIVTFYRVTVLQRILLLMALLHFVTACPIRPVQVSSDWVWLRKSVNKAGSTVPPSTY
jgi:hypothetical protein